MNGLPRIGCDVVDVARLAARMERRSGLAERVFTPMELLDVCRGGVAAGSQRHRERLAARFAAKEATRKAMGDLRLPFHATEVVTGADGAPSLRLRGRDAGGQVSLSHDGGVAMAVVLLPATLHAQQPAPGMAPHVRPLQTAR